MQSLPVVGGSFTRARLCPEKLRTLIRTWKCSRLFSTIPRRETLSLSFVYTLFNRWNVFHNEKRVERYRACVYRAEERGRSVTRKQENPGHFVNPSRVQRFRGTFDVEYVTIVDQFKVRRLRGHYSRQRAGRNLPVWLPLITPGPGRKSWNLGVPRRPSPFPVPSRSKGKRKGWKKSTKGRERERERGGGEMIETRDIIGVSRVFNS